MGEKFKSGSPQDYKARERRVSIEKGVVFVVLVGLYWPCVTLSFMISSDPGWREKYETIFYVLLIVNKICLLSLEVFMISTFIYYSMYFIKLMRENMIR